MLVMIQRFSVQEWKNATHARVQGQSLGGQPIGMVARRCLRMADEAGGEMLIIDARTERAAGW